MNDKEIAIYRELLLEIKFRVEAIDMVFSGDLKIRDKIGEEFCYLQLRMICELIATGCLIIHGDIVDRRGGLLKTYKADWIMKEMSRLHPNFYPQPLEDDKIDENGERHWVYKSSGFLNQSDLAELWAKCGDKLHRGSAKNILKSTPRLNFSYVKTARNKLVQLLDRHVIWTFDEERACFFCMEDGNGNVFSAAFSRLPD